MRYLRPVGIVALLAIAGIALIGGASYLGRSVGQRFGGGQATTPVQVEPGIEVEVSIPPGASAEQIGRILAQAGVVRSAVQFEAVVRSEGVAERLRSGTYVLVTGMTPEDVIEVLLRGPAVATVQVTIPEGLRVVEIIGRLAEATGRPEAEFERALTEGRVSTGLREMPAEPTLADWEGLLFPDTYRFTQEASPADILGVLARTAEERVASVDWSRVEAMGMTVYEGIIVASLVEAEVRVDEERPLVASVIYNRLGDGQRLEIDATVLYALGVRDPALFDRSVDSPYNTYQVDGLPPTPIAAPGLASLRAAADPADTTYRYYVLSSPDGRHTFSTTFEEHQRAVEEARRAGVLP